jgi:hypothetical protein
VLIDRGKHTGNRLIQRAKTVAHDKRSLSSRGLRRRAGRTAVP